MELRRFKTDDGVVHLTNAWEGGAITSLCGVSIGYKAYRRLADPTSCMLCMMQEQEDELQRETFRRLKERAARIRRQVDDDHRH